MSLRQSLRPKRIYDLDDDMDLSMIQRDDDDDESEMSSGRDSLVMFKQREKCMNLNF